MFGEKVLNRSCVVAILVFSFLLSSCAEVSVPDSRNVKIPSPVSAEQRREAINERPDSVMYLPLGDDVLVPARAFGGALPTEMVGPFELRSETLAGALQLILADYDVAIAFETEEGLTRKVTVANLSGELGKVVSRVCSLADLYCAYDGGVLTVKDTEIFAVVLPPLGGIDGGTEFLDDVIVGLTAIVGEDVPAPIADNTTRAIIYTATQRTAPLAENYFERLRANTAMIVFETYIWEVSLNSGNSAGINWSQMEEFGAFNTSIGLNGAIGADFTNPVSIGLPTRGTIGTTPEQLVQFLSQFGALKTISQPQITVLSGSSAELRVADTENFVSEIVTTITDSASTTSVNTGSVDSGFTLSVGSSWDKSTVYADIGINLTNVNEIEDFTFSDGGAGGTSTTIQLPQTSERELTTQIRVRPGDSVLIAGLVRENDNFSSRGPGFMEPILPDSRTAETQNLELVVLLRPRVIVYTANDDKRYLDYSDSKNPQRQVAPAPIAAIPTPVPPAPAPVYIAPAPIAAPAPEPEPIIVTTPPEPIVVAPPPPAPAPIMPEPIIFVEEPAPIIAEPVIETIIEDIMEAPQPVIEAPQPIVMEAPELIVEENIIMPPETLLEPVIVPEVSEVPQPSMGVRISPALSFEDDAPVTRSSNRPSISPRIIMSDDAPDGVVDIAPQAGGVPEINLIPVTEPIIVETVPADEGATLLFDRPDRVMVDLPVVNEE